LLCSAFTLPILLWVNDKTPASEYTINKELQQTKDEQKQMNGCKLYEVRIEGHLHGDWRDWFGEMNLACLPDGTLALTGPVADQAALFGLLARVRDLGLTLVAVNQLPPSREDA
jgi:hypothetical protein